jgi:hypothetical protein
MSSNCAWSGPIVSASSLYGTSTVAAPLTATVPPAAVRSVPMPVLGL